MWQQVVEGVGVLWDVEIGVGAIGKGQTWERAKEGERRGWSDTIYLSSLGSTNEAATQLL